MARDGAAAAPAAEANGARVSDADLAELRQQLARKTEDEEAQRRRADDNATRAEQLERERDEANRRVSSEVDQRFRAQDMAIERGIAASASEADRLEEQIAELNEKGEFREATKKTRELADAQFQLNGWRAREQEVVQAKERMKLDYEQRKAQADQRAQDPLAKYGPPGSATRRWIDAHPRFLTDAAYQSQVTRAHHKALADGHEESTPDYFRSIEETLGDRKRDAPATPGKSPPPPPAASPDQPLSEAAEVEEATTPPIETADEFDIEAPPSPDTGDVDMYEQSLQETRERREAQPASNKKAPPARSATAAPPSRGNPTGTSPPRNDGRVRLTQAEAEQALICYPPGEKGTDGKPVVYNFGGHEFVVKTNLDAYRLFHMQKQELGAAGKLSPAAMAR